MRILVHGHRQIYQQTLRDNLKGELKQRLENNNQKKLKLKLKAFRKHKSIKNNILLMAQLKISIDL
jgi:hypothetical protein